MHEHRNGAPKTILLATDFSARCDRAFDRAVELALKWGAHLAVACAIEGGSRARPAGDSSTRATYEALLLAQRRVATDLQEREVDFGVYIEEAAPTALIGRLIDELTCDLVITGTARSETFGRMALGSTVERLARQCSVPILVVKTRNYGPYETVLIGTDFSPASAQAVRRAADLFPKASLAALHCYRDAGRADAAGDGDRHGAESERDAFLRDVPAEVRRRLEFLLEEGPLRAMVDTLYADRGVDLLVLGSTGRGRLLEMLLGSTASTLLESAPCDVMIVPMPPAATAEPSAR